MGMVKTAYNEIWKLEKEIIEAETDIDEYRKEIVKAEAKLGPIWKKAISSKGDVPLPIQKEMTAINDLINKELPAEIAKARKRYDVKKAMQKNTGISLHRYILKKLDSARPGQYTQKKIAFYRRLAEEMRHNFV